MEGYTLDARMIRHFNLLNVNLKSSVNEQATKASAAQSRVKMLQKMEANATPLPEGKSNFRAKMRLPTPPACHTKQVSQGLYFQKHSVVQVSVV